MCSQSSAIVAIHDWMRDDITLLLLKSGLYNNINNCIIPCFIADEEFDELCFEFGLELDEIVSHYS